MVTSWPFANSIFPSFVSDFLLVNLKFMRSFTQGRERELNIDKKSWENPLDLNSDAKNRKSPQFQLDGAEVLILSLKCKLAKWKQLSSPSDLRCIKRLVRNSLLWTRICNPQTQLANWWRQNTIHITKQSIVVIALKICPCCTFPHNPRSEIFHKLFSQGLSGHIASQSQTYRLHLGT